MGALAKSAFLTMMGWIRSLSSEIWRTFTSPDGETTLRWIGANWKIIAVILCAAGLAADLIIYLIRWQPYRVWSSFFRRIRHRREEEPEETDESSGEAYADGESPMIAATPEERTFPAAKPADSSLYRAPAGGNRRYFREPQDEEEFYPVTEAGQEEFPEPETEAGPGPVRSRPEPEGTTEAFEQAILPRRRRRVARLFSDPEEEAAARPEDLIDRYAAYRRPVYPRSWKMDEGDREEDE